MLQKLNENSHSALHVSLYWFIFLVLVALTGVTVLLSQIEFGAFSLLIALLLASIKASLIFAVFMHLWFDSKFYTLIVIIAFVILTLFISIPILDLGSRDLCNEHKIILPIDKLLN